MHILILMIYLLSTFIYQDKNDCNQLPLPDFVKEVVKENYPDSRLPEKSDFSRSINNIIDANKHPEYCSGDFNGDHICDFCLVLLNKTNQVSIIVIESMNDTILAREIDSFDYSNRKIDIILKLMPSGIWESITDSINVINDGISIDFYDESMGWAYYREQNSYTRFLFD